MVGLMPPVNAHLPDLPNQLLLARALLHVCYGFVGFALVLVAGLSVLGLPGLGARLRDRDKQAFALPAGICVGIVLAAFASVVPFGTPIASVLFVALVASRVGSVIRLIGSVALPVRTGLLALFAIATLAAHQAIMWRPPTEGTGGTVDPGDLTIYVGYFLTLTKQFYPFFNHGAEGEVITLYFMQPANVLAIGISWLPGFEIGMLLAAGGVVFSLMSICYTLLVLVRYRQDQGAETLAGATIALVAILVMATTRYPTFVVESPPVGLLYAFALSLCYAVHRAGDSISGLAGTIVFGWIGSAFSKVVALPVFAAYSGFALLFRCIRQMSPFQLFLLFGFGLILAAYSIFMLYHYSPDWLPRMNFGPQSWERFERKGWERFDTVIPYLMRDLGAILIVVGAFAMRDLEIALTVLIGVAFQFISPFLFYATQMSAMSLLAGTLLLCPKPSRLAFWSILLGSVMMIEHHVDEDPGKWHMGVIWVVTVGPAVWLTLIGVVGRTPARIGYSVGLGRAAWASMCVLAVISVLAAASGSLRMGNDDRQIVSVALMDIWQKTRSMTPQNSLIFTDQTGPDHERLSGWNDLALMSQRQFYITSTQYSYMLYDREAHGRRLEKNMAVLEGQLRPSDLGLSRSYDAYYAVTANAHRAPASFDPVYRNDGYTLHRIDGE